MFRGTTPKLEFIFDYNLEDLNIEEFYITIKQGNKLISEKQLKDINISKNKAIIKLTQSETLSMKETYNVLMQARLKVNGEAYATDIVSVGVASILKDGTIPGGSVDPDNPDSPGCDCGTIDYNDLKNKPTKLSDFINDGVFITNTVNDLINYYTKSQTYTKEEINNLVSVIPKFDIDVVSELPTENISSTTIYLLPSNSSANDMYKEYIYVNNNWELLGIQKIDLTDYYNKTEINTLLSSKVNTNDLATETTNGLMSSDDKVKLNGIASGANVNVQSDWNQTDTSTDDFIKNKPTIPTQLSDLSGTLSISQGGTGATTASGARTNLGFSTSTSLYTNLSGTFSTITLSDSISNYDAIGVYYFWFDSSTSTSNYIQFLPSYGKLSLARIEPPSNGDGVVIAGYAITASTNTITFASYTYYRNLYATNWGEGLNTDNFHGNYIVNYPYITKVVGYKF